MVDATVNGAVPVATVEMTCPVTFSMATFAVSKMPVIPLAFVLIVLINPVAVMLVTPDEPPAFVITSGVTTKLTIVDGVKPTPLTRYVAFNDIPVPVAPEITTLSPTLIFFNCAYSAPVNVVGEPKVIDALPPPSATLVNATLLELLNTT